MAQNNPKPRGRPRAYDPEVALQRATDAFWKAGYSGTSLDEIAAATRMNRPSLQAAFGDKRAIYLKALRAYWDAKLTAMRDALRGDRPLDAALIEAFETALSIYFAIDEAPRGCFVLGTAITEAVDDSEIGEIVAAGFRALDTIFEDRFKAAVDAGEIADDADPQVLATIATATMQTIALRARAGFPREELGAFARKAIRTICR